MEALAALLPQPSAQAGATAPDVSSMLAILRSAGAIPGLDLSSGSATAQGPEAALLTGAMQAASDSGDQGQPQPTDAEVPDAVKAEPNAAQQPPSPGRVKEEGVTKADGPGPVESAPVLAGDAGGVEAPDIGSNLFALLGQLAPAGQ